MDAIEQSRQVGVAAFSGGETVRSAWGMWAATLDGSSADHRSCAGTVGRRIIARLGARPLAVLRPQNIEDWLKADYPTETTRSKAYRYARAWHRWCVRRGLAEHDIMRRVEAPSPSPRIAILTPAEMSDALTADMPEHVRAWLLLGGSPGSAASSCGA